jgi:conjugative transfer pilus assembly protein TraH
MRDRSAPTPALLLTVALLAGSVIFSSSHVRANSLESEMGSMFDDVMLNETDPSVIDTARRGGLSGGSFRSRSEIMTMRPVDLTLPSFSAGCGGIDLTGGSFSFINAEQFVEFAKSVAQNAVGYAFYLALDSFMPQVAANMKWLQEKVSELNQFFGNSCATAQAGVDALKGALDNKASREAEMAGEGDTNQTFTMADGRAPDETERDNPVITQNLIWKQLSEQGVDSWFAFGDTELMEITMNLTGTIVVGSEYENGSDGDSPVTRTLPGAITVSLDDLVGDMTGQSSITYYPCQDGTGPNQCLQVGGGGDTRPRMKTVQFEGYAARINEYFNDIIDNMYVGAELTSNQKAFLSALPAPIPSTLFRLSRISPSVARGWARSNTMSIATTMAYQLIDELHSAGMTAAQNSTHTWSSELGEIISDSSNRIYQQYQVMVQTHGSIPDAVAQYNNLLSAMPKSGLTAPISAASDR